MYIQVCNATLSLKLVRLFGPVLNYHSTQIFPLKRRIIFIVTHTLSLSPNSHIFPSHDKNPRLYRHFDSLNRVCDSSVRFWTCMTLKDFLYRHSSLSNSKHSNLYLTRYTSQFISPLTHFLNLLWMFGVVNLHTTQVFPVPLLTFSLTPDTQIFLSHDKKNSHMHRRLHSLNLMWLGKFVS